MKESISTVEIKDNGILILGKKNEESGYVEKVEVYSSENSIGFEIEQTGWNEYGLGTDYNSFSLSKEQALALAEKILKTFNV